MQNRTAITEVYRATILVSCSPGILEVKLRMPEDDLFVFDKRH